MLYPFYEIVWPREELGIKVTRNFQASHYHEPTCDVGDVVLKARSTTDVSVIIAARTHLNVTITPGFLVSVFASYAQSATVARLQSITFQIRAFYNNHHTQVTKICKTAILAIDMQP